MKIGVVVYSQTGNTLSVAQRLEEKLSSAGHTVALEQVTVAGGRKQGDRQFELEAKPSVGSYDVVIFGTAVEAFSLSPVMTRYLKQMETLEGKKVACLVTQQFPYPWMGGNRAVRQMQALCAAKGGVHVGSGVVNWAESKREKTTVRALDQLSRAVS